MNKSLNSFIAFGFVFLSFLGRSQSSGFEVIKNMELLDLIYQHLDLYYVDEPQPGKLSKVGIDAMLKELDPYTVFYHENNIEDYRLMTTGQYGGVGALIRKMDEAVYFIEPYENSPAQKSGIKAGDKILSIDGKTMIGKQSDDVSSALKGPKGTSIKVEIERQGVTKEIMIERDEIKIPDVPYSGFIQPGIGYIKLNSFTQTASSDVKKAFLELKSKGMTSAVLDLRGNGGGLLIEAVRIVNMFVKKGQIVVTTKGRIPEENQTYLTTDNPLDLSIPLTVLIDEGSASASEIVAGTLQDLDRAVVIGTNSYGKGLVQRTYDLKYGSKMKLTIAKYYTPSGRCVQRLDYYDREDGTKPEAVPDSLIKKFKTVNGREVIDGRGIEPDLVVEKNELSNLTATVYANDFIFNFATKYANSHPEIGDAKVFNLTDTDYSEFKKQVLAKEFTYSTESLEMLNKMKETAEKEGYFQDIEADYKDMLLKVTPSKERDLDKFKSE
ncbi:MAG: S41 family peptidase, partial [Bacteroidetes bacterium]|nr:S41 family peptidase [Bacteroidota bacterium]